MKQGLGRKKECKCLPVEQKEAYQEQAVFLPLRVTNQDCRHRSESGPFIISPFFSSLVRVFNAFTIDPGYRWQTLNNNLQFIYLELKDFLLLSIVKGVLLLPIPPPILKYVC